MNAKRKTSGFFIVEILIVLVIIVILTLLFLPNLETYVKRGKFVDVVRAVNAVKPQVELCIIDKGSVSTDCKGGTSGIQTDDTTTHGYLADLKVVTGVITGTAVTNNGMSGETLVLTPTRVSTGQVTWGKTGTCSTAGLC